MKTKILVTGSSGQLGSYVCERLSRDHEVVGLDTRPQPFEPLKKSCVVGDITSRADVSNALRGVRWVVHCAAQVSVEKSTKDPVFDANVNILGTVNMLQLSSEAQVERFVYVSSAAIFGQPKYTPIDEAHPTEPISNYGVAKLSGEKYALAFARNSPMEVTSVRPFNFYSPRADPSSPYSGVITKFVNRLKSGKPPVIEGDGLQTRDFIHALDVVEMISLMLDKKGLDGQVFNCGSGHSTSILDLAISAIMLSGLKVKPEFTSPRVGDIRESLANCAKAKQMLGFKPTIDLDQGLAELLK
ncbi:MAG: NAD-dependent epimerase/dehydratase family protein [Thermoplasmata archaeon]|nr:NAD-dependent epimerase/dehydratase family protein [Thermoplasmata archaeon]